MQSTHNLMGVMLDNLKVYYGQANTQLKGKAGEDRKKISIKNVAHSHNDQIEIRLNFMKYYAQQSENFAISRPELEVIYDLMVAQSVIPTDEEQFLSWCNSSCESASSNQAIMNLSEVGDFFTTKISQNQLNVKDLAPVGFEFLQQYFLSVNEKADKIEKVKPKQSYTGYAGYGARNYGMGNDYRSSYSWASSGVTSYGNNNQQDEKKSSDSKFNVKVLPRELNEIELLWTLVLNCEHPEVAKSVVGFFIKVHLSLSKEIQSEKTSIIKELIERCMSILKQDKQSFQMQ